MNNRQEVDMQDKYKVGDTETPNIINADNSELIDVFVDGVKIDNVGEVHLASGYVICLDDERNLSNKSKRIYFKMVTIEKEVKLVSRDSGKGQVFYFWSREPHQQRVIDEKKELDDKAQKLSDFIGFSDIFLGLPADEQERLKIQNDIMWKYSEVLGERIKAF